MFAADGRTFKQFYFDEKTCNGWHLYGVNLSLDALKKNINSYVVPINLYHKSTGKLSVEYAWTLFKVIRRHRKWIDSISTTCTTTSTKTFRSVQYTLRLIYDHVIIGR